MTIANMTTEWGALVGWFPFDEVTADYLRERAAVLAAHGAGQPRLTERDDRRLGGRPARRPTPTPLRRPRSSSTSPRSRRTSPVRTRSQVMRAGDRDRARADRDPQGLPAVVRQRTARRPGRGGGGAARARGSPTTSSSTSPPPRPRSQAAAEADGIWQALLEAGARAAAARLRRLHRPRGRSARDGRGRHLRHQPQLQGPHGLARRQGLPREPGGGRRLGGRRLHHRPGRDARHVGARVRVHATSAGGRRSAAVAIRRGLSRRARRPRCCCLPVDNLNTDGIYGKDVTYRDDLTPEQMAGVRDGQLRPGVPGDRRATATSSSPAATSAPARRASRRPRR